MDRDNETHPFIEQNKDGKRDVADVRDPPKMNTTWSSARAVIVSLLLVMQNNTMSTSLYVASRCHILVYISVIAKTSEPELTESFAA